MSDGQDLDSQSFNKNYKILKETADWLSRQDEPDIDQLVPKVERAMGAQRICKERLEAVQQTLGQYLRDGKTTGEPIPTSPDRDGGTTSLPVSGNGENDDTPF